MAEVSGYPIGLARLLIWLYPNTSAQAGGFTGTQTTLANGIQSGAFVEDDVKTAGLNYAPVTDLTITGGDRIKATPSWSNVKLTPFDCILSSVESGLNNLIQQSKTNNVNPYAFKYSYNSNKASPRSIGIAVQQRFETKTGFQWFKTRIIPRATASYHPGTMGYRTESDSVLHISPTTGNRSYTGELYSNSNLDFELEQDVTDYYDYDSSDSIYIMGLRFDGTISTINLSYRPLSTVVTLNNTPNEFVIFNSSGSAIPTALASITTGAGAQAQMGTAGTAGDLGIITYSTNYVVS